MTDVEIINLALSDCGVAPITSLLDDVAAARQAKAKYPAIKDALLEDREWTFAKDRLLLAQDPAAPVFGYTYAYVIPSTVLRVCRCWDGGGNLIADWVRERWRILTDDASPIYAEAIVRVGEGEFSPGAVLALSYRLTSVFAIPLTENRQLAADFEAKYQVQINDAAAMDGSQGRMQALKPVPLPGRQSSR